MVCVIVFGLTILLRMRMTSLLLGWHVCRTKLARKIFCPRHEFSHEKCSEIFPEVFEPLFCGSKKIPHNSRQISHKISLPKIKKNSPTSFCRGSHANSCALKKRRGIANPQFKQLTLQLEKPVFNVQVCCSYSGWLLRELVFRAQQAFGLGAWEVVDIFGYYVNPLCVLFPVVSDYSVVGAHLGPRNWNIAPRILICTVMIPNVAELQGRILYTPPPPFPRLARRHF